MRKLKAFAVFLMGFGLSMAISKYNSNWVLGTLGVAIFFVGLELRYKEDES